MTDKEVLQRFKKDFDKIESPDLWDKIQEKQAQIEPVQEVKTKRKNIPLRYALAACFAVLMVGIGMLALVLSKGNDILIEPSEQPSQVSVYSEQPSQASTASEPISTVSDDEADLIVTDPIQAGVMAVMAVASTAVFDVKRLANNNKF